jgi:hypothetical protein
MVTWWLPAGQAQRAAIVRDGLFKIPKSSLS